VSITLEELEQQVNYWAQFGFCELPDTTRRGELCSSSSEALYGVDSKLTSVRLFHQDSDHGLVRIMCFTDHQHLPPLRLANLKCLGARWGAQLTTDVYNVLNHAEDAEESGKEIKYMGPFRSTIYRLEDDAVNAASTGPFFSTTACVREMVFLQPYSAQNLYQRYEYTIPHYGKVDPQSKFKSSQITHFGLVSQGGFDEIRFYADVLGLLDVSGGEGANFTFEEAEHGDRVILGLDQPGDQFYTTNVDGPESSTEVQEYRSGRLHILRYAADCPSKIPDQREQSRPGTIGPNNYTLSVENLSHYYDRIRASEIGGGVATITDIVMNEFGENSFSFVAPDGYHWTILQVPTEPRQQQKSRL
jgi:hypothetical protein